MTFGYRNIGIVALLSGLLVAVAGAATYQADKIALSDDERDVLRRFSELDEGYPQEMGYALHIDGERPGPEVRQRIEVYAAEAWIAFLMSTAQWDKAREQMEAFPLPPEEWPPSLHIQRITLAMETGNLDTVVELANRCIELYPSETEAYLKLADVYHREGKQDKVIEVLEDALVAAPRNELILRNLDARYRLKMQRSSGPEEINAVIDRLHEIATRMIELRPGRRSAQARRLLVLIEEGRGNMEAARDQMSALVRLESSDAQHYLDLARYEMALKNPEGAQDALRRGVIAVPENRALLAGVNQVIGGLDPPNAGEAILEFYRDIAGQYPGRADIQMLYARNLLIQNRAEEAVDVMQESLSHDPHDPAGLMLLAHAANLAEKPEVGREAVVQYIDLSPLDPEVLSTGVGMLVSLGYTQDAEEMVQGYIEQFPEDWEMHLLLAGLYQQSGQSAELDALLQETSQRFDQQPDALYEVAMVEYDRGNAALALDQLQRITEMDPDNVEAFNSLGYLLAERGERLDEALGFVQKAMQLSPGQAHIIDSLGWIYFKQGQHAQAMMMLQQASRLSERGDPVIQEHLAEAYLKLGRDEEALDALETALELVRRDPMLGADRASEIEKRMEEIRNAPEVTAQEDPNATAPAGLESR